MFLHCKTLERCYGGLEGFSLAIIHLVHYKISTPDVYYRGVEFENRFGT